jgi:hypothetical protein
MVTAWASVTAMAPAKDAVPGQATAMGSGAPSDAAWEPDAAQASAWEPEPASALPRDAVPAVSAKVSEPGWEPWEPANAP